MSREEVGTFANEQCFSFDGLRLKTLHLPHLQRGLNNCGLEHLSRGGVKNFPRGADSSDEGAKI